MNEKVMLILLVVGIISIVYVAVIGINKESVEDIEFKTYTVKTGDTLWSIASGIEDDEDIREIIFYIEKDNNITNCGNLQVGQELKIRLDY